MQTQGRQGTWNRRVRGCAPQAGPRNFRVFEGLYTRPARPPEASSAGPPEAYIFLRGAEIRRSRLWSLTETGAGCTSGACSSVQNTAFPGRACSRKGGSSAGARGASQLLGNRRVPGAGTAGSWNRRGGLKCTIIAVLEWLAIWNRRVLTPLRSEVVGEEGHESDRPHRTGRTERAPSADVPGCVSACVQRA